MAIAVAAAVLGALVVVAMGRLASHRRPPQASFETPLETPLETRPEASDERDTP
jgi:hypothetical protein